MNRTYGAVALAAAIIFGCFGSGECIAKQKVLPARVAKSNVEQVNSKIHWHTNLNSALARAKREGKMVLWIHMIGKVDGAT